MTLIAGKVEQINEPRTHVLIIGVGDYPNAQRGNVALLALRLGISHLTSSTLSAREFAKWCLSDFYSKPAEIGSIELVISEPGPGTAYFDHPVTKKRFDNIDRADFAGIQSAFQRWEKRCNAHGKNLAVLFFSGHAAEGANRILFPSDFPLLMPINSQPDWSKTVNFNATRTHMLYCRAAQQVFFLDCCRFPLTDELAESALGMPMIFPRAGQRQAVDVQHVFTIPKKMTTGGSRDRVSDFTNLILHGLRGAGAVQVKKGWQVTGNSILKACKEIKEAFLEEGLEGNPYPRVEKDLGTPERDDPLLHMFQMNNSPLVPTCVRCQPSSPFGTTYTAQGSSGTVTLEVRSDFSYARGFLNPGEYTLSVSFPGGGSQPAPKKENVEPPVCHSNFEV